MAINREWHEKNRMPKNPTLEQRMNWHEEHAKNCDCRKMPEKLAKLIEERRKSLESGSSSYTNPAS